MKLVALLVFVGSLSSPTFASAAVPKTSTKAATAKAVAASSKSSAADRDAMADALWKGELSKAKKLHKKGVSYDALSSSDDMTGLMRAADEGIDELIKDILALGANINTKNASGENALWYATYSGHEKLALWLIAKGASAEGQRTDSKECLLHMAVQADLVQLSKKLMKLTPHCATIKDQDGHTPADVAKSLGYDKLAKIVSAKTISTTK
jgi:ankyrin repeat protein